MIETREDFAYKSRLFSPSNKFHSSQRSLLFFPTHLPSRRNVDVQGRLDIRSGDIVSLHT